MSKFKLGDIVRRKDKFRIVAIKTTEGFGQTPSGCFTEIEYSAKLEDDPSYIPTTIYSFGESEIEEARDDA